MGSLARASLFRRAGAIRWSWASASAFVVMVHTNAIYSPPGVGGILLEQPEGDFRIDHDLKFNATTNVQYVFEKRTGAWV
jgi:hypothetical protein